MLEALLVDASGSSWGMNIMGTILVLEKDGPILELASNILRKEGHRIIPCRNPQQAIKALSGRTVDLILSELFAPPYSYLENALHSLQSLRKAAPDVPVILFTEWLGLTEKMAQSEGFLGLIRKPFDLDELIGKVAMGITRESRGISEKPTGWYVNAPRRLLLDDVRTETAFGYDSVSEPSLVTLER